MFIELLMCCCACPLYFVIPYSPTSNLSCVVVASVFQTLNHANNWAGVLLALNRLVALVFPYHYTGKFSKFFAALGIPLMWSYIFIGSIPLYNQTAVTNGLTSSGVCAIIQTFGLYSVVIGSCNTYLPICIMGAAYLAILINQKRAVRGRVGTEQPVRNNVERRLTMTKILFSTFLVNCVCLFPAPLIMHFYPLVWRSEARATLWVRTAGLAGYAVNPVLFFAISRDYRKGFMIIARYAQRAVQRHVDGKLTTASVTA
ncbi:histamine H2 receptor-like [Paramacrobiotus metropolitanus]|uniref:histamine H2 receptor-like n=1 Tax=Paramacrobiotus metropolitanus TaxID=2943436 RepID=UPI0024464D9F|nr:histamine H2 receptor-like [Paramacrobiotus metropolitanus]